MNDLPNAMDIYALYAVMFPQPFSIRRKCVIFSAVLAGEPWSWQVIGISQAALEALSKTDFRYVGRTICRAHIIDRITTAGAIFNIAEPLSQKKLFKMLVETGRTIITIKSENKLAARLPYFPIDRTQGLFKNQLISFKYGRTERNALRELHANVIRGGVRLVIQDPGASPLPQTLKTSTVEITPAADGKRAFKGTIGKSQYLLDAGNGEIVLELKSNRGVVALAATANRVLVPRREASRYAVKSLIRRWHLAKKGTA